MVESLVCKLSRVFCSGLVGDIWDGLGYLIYYVCLWFFYKFGLVLVGVC